ncbi:hypothetical protein CEE36_03170 [candidate division TA06 bacterium B3_TA06]|uniref:DUF4249 family protein n=1 Tax=candidate division TA06 bacterium B3_TA06 TaxID=2012487 RepID=A0A532V935_UNCT6|nr:MAG: hypothetical protein CEE36_03170 [candidate division TA06 bacterium B3_TA06]
MRFRIIPAIILLLSVIACDTTPETYEGEPNIYAVLTTDSSFACIMVGKTTSVGDTLALVPDTIMDTFWYDDTFEVWLEIVFPWSGVSGAEVSLKQGEQSFALAENEDSVGYYYSDSIQLLAGQTWELEVTYPSGEEIEAQTTIPGSFEITGFQTDTISTTDTLAWSKSSDAAGYLVKAFVWASWEDEDADTVYIDSAFTYPELLPGDSYSIPLEELDLWGDSLWFWVSALDTNAYDYRYYGEDRGDPGIRVEDYMHIEGAWGVFGSQAVVCSQRYVLR